MVAHIYNRYRLLRYPLTVHCTVLRSTLYLLRSVHTAPHALPEQSDAMHTQQQALVRQHNARQPAHILPSELEEKRREGQWCTVEYCSAAECTAAQCTVHNNKRNSCSNGKINTQQQSVERSGAEQGRTGHKERKRERRWKQSKQQKTEEEGRGGRRGKPPPTE